MTARATRRDLRLATPPRLLAQGLVLASVVAATAGFAAAQTTVTLDVDGSLTTVTAFGATVDDVLASHDVAVRPADLVVPAPGTRLHDGDTVVVRRARPVAVVVDGEARTVWTTATTVADVADQLGVRGDYAASASRSAPIGRQALHLATARTVHVTVDGRTTDVRTTERTVRGALAEAGVVLGPYDRVSVALDAETVDGLAVLVTRVTTETRTRETVEKARTVREDDPTLPKGREVVAQQGRDGLSVTTYVAHLVAGEEVDRTVLARSVVQTPVDRVVRVGTADVPEGGTWTGDGDVWSALARCESGGNPSIVSSNGLYHGLYQFSVGTWQSVGGSGLPSQATPEEQTKRAKILQERSGWGQWPACSSKLGLR